MNDTEPNLPAAVGGEELEIDSPQAPVIVARKSQPSFPTEASSKIFQDPLFKSQDKRLENLTKNYLKFVNDGELGRAKGFILF